MLTYGIVGFGGLGKTHFNNYTQTYKETGEAKLVAICDIEEERFKVQTATNLDEGPSDLNLSEFNLYKDVDEMLDNEKLDFVITALPTYLHEPIDVKIMKRGIHVFSEKPMAYDMEQADNMMKVAKENNVKLMIGMVMRHEAEYKVLKEAVESGKYGKVLRADFYRNCGTPIWGWQNWYCDVKKSGGAILDLHIHDVDFINYLFGMPDYLTSHCTHFKTGFESVATTYVYGDTVVTARGDWGSPSETYGFRCGYSVRFEKAVLEFDNKSVVLYEDDKKTVIEPTKNKHFLDEERDFMRCILEDKESEIIPVQSSYNTLKLVMSEKESALNNGEKIYFNK